MTTNAANQAREYVRGWEQTGQILEEMKRAELRKMTEADAAKIFTELVEQQRWFMRAHAHRARS